MNSNVASRQEEFDQRMLSLSLARVQHNVQSKRGLYVETADYEFVLPVPNLT